MMLLFGWFMFGVSEHSFILKASKKLFLARTKDAKLFKKDPRQNIDVQPLSAKAKKEIDLHRAIKLHAKDNIFLYLSNRFGCCFPSFMWPN